MSGRKVKGLTEAQERFCREFVIDLNATAAYRRAYPNVKPNSAETAGPRLLGNVGVAARIAELKAKREERTDITADQVITELARIGFSDMRHFSEWGPDGVTLKASSTLTEDQARCIAEVSESTTKDGGSLKFKLHDKVGALIKLGQHLGIRFVEQHEHSGKDGGPIEVESLTPAERATRVRDLLALATHRQNGNGTHA